MTENTVLCVCDWLHVELVLWQQKGLSLKPAQEAIF